jgi:flavin-dependent dehydrogenase
MEVTRQPPACTFDLAVIGGGPAGASAAITVARTGAHVLLLERGRLPRQRVCGEFVSAESLDLLIDLLGNTNSELLSGAPRITQARLYFDGHVVSAPVDPPAASLARFDLDFALWRAADEAGACAQLETSVHGIAGDGPFTLSTSGGEFSARALIDASGRWSNLRNHVTNGNQNTKCKWLGLKAHYAEQDAPSSVDLYFFEGGYCGVQLVILHEGHEAGHRVNACAMVRSDMARTLPEVFALHPKLCERSQNWHLLMEPVSTSPLIFREPEPVRGNVLQTGDAAAFVDPFIGDGISLALRSGALAAQCLGPFFGGQATLSEAAVAYSQAYRQRLLPVFRTSSRLRRLLSLPRPVRGLVGHLLEAAPTVSRLLVKLTR